MPGEINGTSVFLEVFNKDTGEFGALAGELSAAPTINNALIEITSKATLSFQQFIEDEGIQSLQLTGDFIFNSDVDYQYVRDAANEKSVEIFRFLNGVSDATGDFDQYDAIINVLGDTSPDGDKLTTSLTLNMTKAPFELLILRTAALNIVRTADSNQILVRSP